MVCRRMWIGSCVAIACVVVTLSAQQRKPTFDVVSVKPVQRPNVPEAMEQAIEQMIAASWGRQGGALRVAAAHVQTLIQFAYEIESYQIIGGPDWMRTDWFAIDARPGAEVSNRKMSVVGCCGLVGMGAASPPIGRSMYGIGIIRQRWSLAT